MATVKSHRAVGHVKSQRSSQTAGTQPACHTWGNENCIPQPKGIAEYALATGEAGAKRLEILHNVYGPGTCRLLCSAGLKRGMRGVDIGCGTGAVTALMAEIVGPDGEVIGVDSSAAQLAEAAAHASAATNIQFVQASAIDTGLPRGAFDFVYSRYLLIHLPDPQAALAEMMALLKPGGILICEDGDLTTAWSEPHSAFEAFSKLWAGLGPKRGVDYTLGHRLYQMVLAAGFTSPEVTFNQPAVAKGENKRLLEFTIAEAGPAFIHAGLITQAELEILLAAMRCAAENISILAVMPRMTQVWAHKPGSAGI
jgi:SAM-dependent methyltransferase